MTKSTHAPSAPHEPTTSTTPPDTSEKPESTRPEATRTQSGKNSGLWRIVTPQLLRGAAMGAADIVPGVSGGTVALVLGIYRRLIEAIHSCVAVIVRVLRGDLRGAGAAVRRVPWMWLGSLAAGMLAMIMIASGPLRSALETYPVQLAGLFVGLIAGAVLLCWRLLDWPTSLNYLAAAVMAVGTFLLLGLSPVGAGAEVAVAPWWAFFLGGAVAICAMILPGISGSFLLVLMGLYSQVIGAVADRDVLTIGIFALGCATGLALASSALRWLLHHHHDLVIAAMVGLMIGSIRILWPWPHGLDSTALELPAEHSWLVPTLLAVLGAVIVLGVEAVATRVRERSSS